MTTLSIGGKKRSPGKFAPTVVIGRGLNQEQAHSLLRVAQESCNSGEPIFGKAMGFAVRHAGQPHFRDIVEYKDEDVKWKHFPFAEPKVVVAEMEKEEPEAARRKELKAMLRRGDSKKDKASEKRQRTKEDRKKWKTTESGLFLPT